MNSRDLYINITNELIKVINSMYHDQLYYSDLIQMYHQRDRERIRQVLDEFIADGQ